MDVTSLKSKLSQALKNRFHFDSFREGQEAILLSVMSRKDTMAVMPTGRGKSLCYQLPASLFEGIVIVVSPLIALMEDQTRQLNAKGIHAGCLHSGQSLDQRKKVFESMRKEKYFILYLSPERVQKEGFADWVKTAPISLFAIDEAHCVSQWGPDFRKEYYQLSLLRDLKPEVPILALTATATPEVLRDIAKQLKLKVPDRHIYGFYRPNLYYQVESCTGESEKTDWVKQALLQHPTGRILIYCGTRALCEELSIDLASTFSKTGYYHAGMSDEDRLVVQTKYETGEIRILAATNAFPATNSVDAILLDWAEFRIEADVLHALIHILNQNPLPWSFSVTLVPDHGGEDVEAGLFVDTFEKVRGIHRAVFLIICLSGFGGLLRACCGGNCIQQHACVGVPLWRGMV